MIPYDIYPLTNAQERVWFTQTIFPNSSMFNIGGTATIQGEINVDILRLAFAWFVREHDALRIRFTIRDGQPFQYFCTEDEWDLSNIPFVDFRNNTNKEENFAQWVKNLAVQPIFMEDMPLYRFAIFSIRPDQYGYLFLMHHILADGWSFQMFTQEIQENYELLSKFGQPLKRSAMEFKKHIFEEKEYLNSPKYEKDKLYWQGVFTPLMADLNVPSPNLSGYRSTFFISEKRTTDIQHFCESLSITKNAFYMGIYILYIYKIKGLTDIVVGNPVLGRSGRKERGIFGMFMNAMPLRYQINSGEPIADYFRNIDKKLKKNFAHQKYPYNHIIRDLSLGYQPLYTTCVNYYNTKMADHFAGKPVTYLEFYNGEQEYDLQLIIRDWQDDLRTQIDIDCKTDYLSPDLLMEMFRRLEMIIDCCIRGSYQLISSISLLTPAERSSQLAQFNNTYSEPLSETIVDVFLKQVKLTPDRCAVKDEKESLTYSDLFTRAFALTNWLCGKGISRGQIVGIFSAGSVEAIVAIFGILASGGAYLPIDPQWPPERIAFVLKDAGIKILLIDSTLPTEVYYTGETLLLKQLLHLEEETEKQLPYIKTDDLAYVIYTSGSTGQPKGVMIEHRSLLNYISWAKKQYIKQDHEIMPLYSSLAFDLTVTTVFLPLICGGTIVVYKDDHSGDVFNQILEENICTLIKLTPAHLRLLADCSRIDRNIHTLIVGGEKFPISLAHKICSCFLRPITIYNEYGPTEATVGCMIYKYDEKDHTDSVPIGRPIDNTSILVLDQDKNPVPIGTKGELYIGGIGLAREYLNHPNLTQKCFLPSLCGMTGPFYRTGDIVRFIKPDCLEYIGRADRQIKINGYRIEPTEIENCLCCCPHIQNAIVVCLNWDETPVLCAYYQSDKQIDTDELNTFVSMHLPQYMVPSIYCPIDSVPLTRNRKIDYIHLPDPRKIETKDVNTNSQPPNERETVLLKCLSVVFGHEVGIDQNFYYAGGDSIKAIQVSSRLHEQGYSLSVKDILAHPIIRHMADCISSVSVPLFDQSPCSGIVPLTPVMEWFFHVFGRREEYQEIGNQYCNCLKLHLSSNWTRSEVEEILQLLLSHHDSLRLNYDMKNHCLKYNENCLSSRNLVNEYNIEGNNKDYETEIKKRKNMLINSMNITNGPLIRADLIHIENKTDILLLLVHHLALDGISWRILLEDLHTLLSQTRSGQSRILPLKTASFQSWATTEIHESGRYRKELSYWEYHRANKVNFPGVCEFFIINDTMQIVLDRPITQSLLTEACEPYRTNVDELLLGALLSTLGIIFDIDEVVIEKESHGRIALNENIDVTRTVGWFTSFYPVRFPTRKKNWDSWIKTIKETLRNVPDMGIGYGLCSDISDRWKEEFQWVRFNYLGVFETEFGQFSVCPDIEIETILPQTNFLDILALIYKGELFLKIRYWPNRLQEKIVRKIAEKWRDEVIDLVHYCINKTVPELTPSDFQTISISQEDLDALFE